VLDFIGIAQVFLNDFEMVPVAHFITGLTFVFTFHKRYYYYYYYYYYLLSPLIQGIYNYIPETNKQTNTVLTSAILQIIIMKSDIKEQQKTAVLGTVHILQTVEVKVKVKFTLKQATKAQRGSKGIALLFLSPRR
jgi:hypothetical protein